MKEILVFGDQFWGVFVIFISFFAFVGVGNVFFAFLEFWRDAVESVFQIHSKKIKKSCPWLHLDLATCLTSLVRHVVANEKLHRTTVRFFIFDIFFVAWAQNDFLESASLFLPAQIIKFASKNHKPVKTNHKSVKKITNPSKKSISD